VRRRQKLLKSVLKRVKSDQQSVKKGYQKDTPKNAKDIKLKLFLFLYKNSWSEKFISHMIL